MNRFLEVDGHAYCEGDSDNHSHGHSGCSHGDHGVPPAFAEILTKGNLFVGIGEIVTGILKEATAMVSDGVHNFGDFLTYKIQVKALESTSPEQIAKLRSLGAWAMATASTLALIKSGLDIQDSISNPEQASEVGIGSVAVASLSAAISLGPLAVFIRNKWPNIKNKTLTELDKDLLKHLTIGDSVSSTSTLISTSLLYVGLNGYKPIDATIGAISALATLAMFRPTKGNLKEDHVPIGELSKDIALGGLSKITNLRNKFKRKKPIKTNSPNTNTQSYFKYKTPAQEIILPAELIADPTFAKGYNGRDFIWGSKKYKDAWEQAIADLRTRGILEQCTTLTKTPEQKNTDSLKENVAKKGLFSFIKSKFKRHKTTHHTNSNKSLSHKFNATSFIGQAQTIYAGLGAKYTQFTTDIGNKIVKKKKWFAPLGVAAVGLTAYKFAPEIIDSFNPDNLLTVDINGAAEQTNPQPLSSAPPSTNDIPANESPYPSSDTSPAPAPNDASADQPTPPEENNLNTLSTEQQLALAGSPDNTTTEPWVRFKEYFGTDHLANIKMANAFELAQNNAEPIQKIYIGDGLNPDLFMYKLTYPSAEDPYNNYEITRILAKYAEPT